MRGCAKLSALRLDALAVLHGALLAVCLLALTAASLLLSIAGHLGADLLRLAFGAALIVGALGLISILSSRLHRYLVLSQRRARP